MIEIFLGKTSCNDCRLFLPKSCSILHNKNNSVVRLLQNQGITWHLICLLLAWQGIWFGRPIKRDIARRTNCESNSCRQQSESATATSSNGIKWIKRIVTYLATSNFSIDLSLVQQLRKVNWLLSIRRPRMCWRTGPEFCVAPSGRKANWIFQNSLSVPISFNREHRTLSLKERGNSSYSNQVSVS